MCLREDPRDALVTRGGATLASLRSGALVGTGSVRRSAQLLAARPDLRVVPLRGNVDTRVRKVREGKIDAAVLAVAGLRRLGLDGDVGEVLPPELMLPAPGQGALAVQCRLDDPVVLDVLAAIDDAEARAAATAERAFLSEVGGGCSAPVGELAEVVGPGIVRLRILVSYPDGRDVVREEDQGEPAEIGALAVDSPQVRDVLATRGRSASDRRSERCARVHGPASGERLAAALGARRRPVVAGDPDRTRAGPAPLDRALAACASTTVVHQRERRCRRARSARALGLSSTFAAVAAVGPATASAVRAGRRAGIRSDVHRAEEIPAGLGDLTGTRILVPQVRPAVDLRLASPAGAEVDTVVAYRTVAVAFTAEARAALARGIDVLLLASGSAARAVAAAARGHEDVRLAVERALVVCTGPRTADVARQVEFSVGFVVEEHTTEGLIRALLARLPGR